MSRNNDVFQVLPTTGNQAPAAVGTALSALGVGQIGVFSASSNLALDGTVATKEFYIALGVDTTGDATQDSIRTSAGQKIQTKNVQFFSFRPHTPSQDQIVEIADYTAECDTDYTVKFEFRNQEIYRRMGHVQFTKPFSIRTSCCTSGCTCPEGDVNEITKLMVNEINNDDDGMLTAQAFTVDAVTIVTHGTTADYLANVAIPVAELDALIAYNVANPTTKVSTKFQVTTNEVAINTFCNINTKFYKFRSTVIITSLVEGFDCNGSITEIQEVAFAEGTGYNIKQAEYNASGWNGKPGPYKVNVSTGLSKDTFQYLTDSSVNYDQLVITYDQESIGGFQEFTNNLATCIAIPVADKVATGQALATILDGLFNLANLGFDALLDDVTAATILETTVEPTEDKGLATDGLSD